MNAKNALHPGTTYSASVSTHFNRVACAKIHFSNLRTSPKDENPKERELPKIQSYLFGFKILLFLVRSGKRKIEAGFQCLIEGGMGTNKIFILSSKALYI